MKQYLDLIRDIMAHGTERKDRTGVGTISVFGRQIRFDMRNGFPAVTTKALAWRSVVSELLFFLEGSASEHRLAEIKNDNKPYAALTEKERRTIWTANYEKQGRDLGFKNGFLGRIYGKQWRDFNGIVYTDEENGLYACKQIPWGKHKTIEIDQIAEVINGIKNDPWSRRLLVSAWNPAELEYMALMPCHYAFQFYVSGADGEYLSLMWNQRSADVCLGIPFNIASYGLLLHIIAKITNKIPLELIGNLGDTHIYLNHLDGAIEQLNREPKKLPELILPEKADYSDINGFLKSVKTSDFKLKDYEHYPAIKFEMAV